MTPIAHNARWLVRALAEVPRHLPLAEFFALEQSLESWPGLVWADRKRWIQFGPKHGQAHIMRKVIGVACADGDTLWDETVREDHCSPVPEGMGSNWEAIVGMEAHLRRKLPWQPASHWRLEVDDGGILTIYHFKVSILEEFV